MQWITEACGHPADSGRRVLMVHHSHSLPVPAKINQQTVTRTH
jgi:hypothetical protein